MDLLKALKEAMKMLNQWPVAASLDVERLGLTDVGHGPSLCRERSRQDKLDELNCETQLGNLLA